MAFSNKLANEANIRKFDFEVYIKASDATGAIGDFEAIKNDVDLESFFGAFDKITKIERNTIIVNTEDGDTIDTNDGQTNIIDKNGNVALSLVSVTLDAINTLRSYNRQDVSFLFVEKCNDKRFLAFVPVATFKYNEAFTSGDVLRLPMSAMKQVSKSGDFVLFNEY